MSLRSKLSGEAAALAQKLFSAGEYKTLEEAESSALNILASNKAGAGAIERSTKRQFPDAAPITNSDPAKLAERDIATLPVAPVVGSGNSSLRNLVGAGGAAVTTLSGDDRRNNYAEPIEQEDVEKKPAGASRTPVDGGRGVGPVANADMYGATLSNRVSGDSVPEEKKPTEVPDYSDSQYRKNVDTYLKTLRDLKPEVADTSVIDKEIQNLRQEYKDARSTNEKKELYQLIATSIAKLGAYKWGLDNNVVIGDKLDIPVIDYTKRTDQSMKEMTLDIDEATGRRKSLLDTVKDRNTQGFDRYKFDATQGIGTESDIYKQKKSDLATDKKIAAEKDLAGNKVDDKQPALLRAEGAKQVDDAAAGAKEAQKKIKSITAAIAFLKAGNKDKAGQALSTAGLDETDMAAIDEASKAGEWWGTDDKKAANYLQSELLPQAKQEYDHLQAAQKEGISLRQTGLNLPNKPAPETQKASAEPTMVAVELADGTPGQVPSEAVKAFLKKNQGSKVK